VQPRGAFVQTFGALLKAPRIIGRVTPSKDLDELLASANGRYLAGPLWLSFIVDPTLVGALVWGRPSAEQILGLVHAHMKMRPALAPRIHVLVDVRYLDWPDPAAFGALVGHVTEQKGWLAEYIVRLALVRSTAGPVGAASAGFFDVSPQPFATQTFTDLSGALTWMGRDDAPELGAELETLFGTASGTPTLLRRLREQLDAQPGAVSLEVAANALAVTERSLQRRLKSWDTSFQIEQNQAQVRAAKEFLREGSLSLAEIASRTGCSSLSHFSALFRRITGETPTDWRKRHRER
jgi:AraC-like DNA-binding protein